MSLTLWRFVEFPRAAPSGIPQTSLGFRGHLITNFPHIMVLLIRNSLNERQTNCPRERAQNSLTKCQLHTVVKTYKIDKYRYICVEMLLRGQYFIILLF
jgi:hypothetical protein